MSRKANISATEKATFGRPRLYAVRAHYGPLDKQPDQFSGAVVVLDDEGEGVVRHAAAAQALCFDEDTTVVVLDVAALRRDVDAAAETRDSKKARGRGKRGWQQALEAECKNRDVLGKDCGRPIAKALARLLMRAPTGATLVARGALAGIALKLALSRDPHAASCNVSNRPAARTGRLINMGLRMVAEMGRHSPWISVVRGAARSQSWRPGIPQGRAAMRWSLDADQAAGTARLASIAPRSHSATSMRRA